MSTNLLLEAESGVSVPFRVRLHDLRHAAATMLLGQGTHPKIVSEMLGHSSIAFTLDTYSHVLPTMGGVAALVIRKAFSSAMEIATPAI